MLTYTDHALRRMRTRGVTKADVAAAITHEVRRYPEDLGKIVIVGSATGRTLKVVVLAADESTVISVFWDEA